MRVSFVFFLTFSLTFLAKISRTGTSRLKDLCLFHVNNCCEIVEQKGDFLVLLLLGENTCFSMYSTAIKFYSHILIVLF